VTVQNQLPVGYVVALVMVMAFMVIDRVIYLSRAKALKTLYHYAALLGVCLWSQLAMGAGPDRPAVGASLAVLVALKALSLALNARQIRCGYPERTREHFLMQVRENTRP
jgi:hypothetical protein